MIQAVFHNTGRDGYCALGDLGLIQLHITLSYMCTAQPHRSTLLSMWYGRLVLWFLKFIQQYGACSGPWF